MMLDCQSIRSPLKYQHKNDQNVSFHLLFLYIMFEKSLTDLIRGIRANKKNEQKYIAVCLQEIRNEVKSNDLDIKSTAVAKLTYVRVKLTISY
jgi:hypothetical protein